MAHPNRWGVEQQRVLEAAAISTGLISAARVPTGLFFLEEGEAAASFCATRPELRKNLQVRLFKLGATPSLITSQPKSRIIVCDAGGSTCDVSSYKVTRISGDIYVKEPELPSCDYL